PIPGDAGVVHENIDLPELLQERLGSLVDRRTVGDVDRPRDRLAACGRDFSRDRPATLGRLRHTDHGDPLRSQRLGNGLADTTPGAGDESGTRGESHGIADFGLRIADLGNGDARAAYGFEYFRIRPKLRLHNGGDAKRG